MSNRLPVWLSRTCLAGQIVTVLIALLSLWIFFEQAVVDQTLDMYWNRLTERSQSIVTFNPLKKQLLTALATLSFFAPVLILLGAFRVFSALRTGDPFRPEATISVRFLGLTILAYGLSKIASHSLSVVLMTYDNPPGQKEFSIAFGPDTLITFMIGVIIVITGHVFTYATGLAEENRQFV